MKDTGRKILEWYGDYKRSLPWRETKNPYLIWISEIILQQTRVNQGLVYYLRFIKRFPDVQSLAKADEKEVLRQWQGLGYYSRARNLHFSARYILSELNGKFPEKYDEILKLKGVGPYTAAAIASISFNLPHPVIDGNVMRVISRLFGIDDPINTSVGQRKIVHELEGVFIKDQPGDFNQAMMEFGALYCTLHDPQCEHCIFNKECVAFNLGKVNELPRKIKAKPPQDLFIYYFVIFNEKKNSIYLRKRENAGIWKNLYDFPSLDSEKKMNIQQIYKTDEFGKLLKNQSYKISKPEILKHQLSHKNIFANFFFIRINEELKALKNKGLIAVKLEKIEEYPVPRLIVSYFNEVFLRQKKASGEGVL